MEYKNFLALIMNFKKILENTSELRDIGFDLYEGKYKLVENIEQIFITSISCFYNEEGIDWINWYIYENDFGNYDWNKYNKTDKIEYPATDENGNPICYSFESLYNHIEENHKLNNDK